MKEQPIWEKYGFASEAAFRKRYPDAGRAMPKANPQQKRKRKLMTKQEQQRMNRYNEVNRGVN